MSWAICFANSSVVSFAQIPTWPGIQARCIETLVPAYADDLVLLAPSWKALQQLLDILQKHINTIDLTCNAKKSVCMIFRPRHSSKVVSSCFPCFRLGYKVLQFVTEFKYLGHVIDNSLTDDDDVKREMRNMFVRTNILLRRFVKCTRDVKVIFLRHRPTVSAYMMLHCCLATTWDRWTS